MKFAMRLLAILCLSLSLISTGERAARASDDKRRMPDSQPVQLAGSDDSSTVKTVVKPEIGERTRASRSIWRSTS